MKTIKGKIIITITVLVICSIAILGGFCGFMSYRNSIDMAYNDMEQLAVVAAERIAYQLKSYQNVAYDSGCLTRLANSDSAVADKRALIDQRASSHGFERGNIIGSDGCSVFDGTDFSERDYYKKAMQGESYISDPLLSKITGKYAIIVAAPLWEGGIPDSKSIGCVYFAPPADFLDNIVASIHISKSSQVYLLNTAGDTIASTSETYLHQNVEELARTDASLSELAEIHASIDAKTTGVASFTENKTKKLIAYAPISGDISGWSIVITSEADDFIGQTKTTIVITIIIALSACLIAILVATYIGNRIGTPIRIYSERLRTLAEGDLKSPVPITKTEGETGVLAASTDAIVKTIMQIIADMERILSSMAAGNFDVHTQENAAAYVGDFSNLLVSTKRINHDLSRTLHRISQASDQVSANSAQLSNGAQALAQGATDQAATIEELVASINEISEKTDQNTKDCGTAREAVGVSSTFMKEAEEKMQHLTAAMTKISSASGEISKIIKAIEDIAFQTNILALNAAVEAARAGEAGKGFAVVASEVRSLASKSQDAAKTTTALIEETIAAVNEGNRITVDTAETLSQATSSSANIHTLITNITQANQAQNDAVSQISSEIDQISAVVQNNSATAQETAASSEELSGQAVMLHELVCNFQLREDAS